MTEVYFVRSHPLGVVVSREPNGYGELLIADEDCCGVSYAELVKIAATNCRLEVDPRRSAVCPVVQRLR